MLRAFKTRTSRAQRWPDVPNSIYTQARQHTQAHWNGASARQITTLFFLFRFFYYLQSIDIIRVSAPLASQKHLPAAKPLDSFQSHDFFDKHLASLAQLGSRRKNVSLTTTFSFSYHLSTVDEEIVFAFEAATWSHHAYTYESNETRESFKNGNKRKMERGTELFSIRTDTSDDTFHAYKTSSNKTAYN